MSISNCLIDLREEISPIKLKQTKTKTKTKIKKIIRAPPAPWDRFRTNWSPRSLQVSREEISVKNFPFATLVDKFL